MKLDAELRLFKDAMHDVVVSTEQLETVKIEFAAVIEGKEEVFAGGESETRDNKNPTSQLILGPEDTTFYDFVDRPFGDLLQHGPSGCRKQDIAWAAIRNVKTTHDGKILGKLTKLLDQVCPLSATSGVFGEPYRTLFKHNVTSDILGENCSLELRLPSKHAPITHASLLLMDEQKEHLHWLHPDHFTSLRNYVIPILRTSHITVWG